jgi:hypothetical protein
LFTPSDRNSKKDFTALDDRDVLEKLLAMSVTRWHYKNDDKAWYMGPMAQDFARAFGLGDKDTVIHQVNADGVAFAAIKGLNAKLEAELARRDAEMRSLAERVSEIERRAQWNGASKAGTAFLGLGMVVAPIVYLRRRKNAKASA